MVGTAGVTLVLLVVLVVLRNLLVEQPKELDGTPQYPPKSSTTLPTGRASPSARTQAMSRTIALVVVSQA